jgi:hypothetical protein
MQTGTIGYPLELNELTNTLLDDAFGTYIPETALRRIFCVYVSQFRGVVDGLTSNPQYASVELEFSNSSHLRLVRTAAKMVVVPCSEAEKSGVAVALELPILIAKFVTVSHSTSNVSTPAIAGLPRQISAAMESQCFIIIFSLK